MNPMQLDQAFNDFTANLQSWIPEGIIEVNLSLLEKTGLLNFKAFEESQGSEQLPHYFHVVEAAEKVTLFNNQFAIWIVPKMLDEDPITLVMIALINENNTHLEIVFSTKGVYNSPKFVIRLLKFYLSEVIDNEEAISSIKKS